LSRPTGAPSRTPPRCGDSSPSLLLRPYFSRRLAEPAAEQMWQDLAHRLLHVHLRHVAVARRPRQALAAPRMVPEQPGNERQRDLLGRLSPSGHYILDRPRRARTLTQIREHARLVGTRD